MKPRYLSFFLFSWVIFALLDPDTDPGTPVDFGSNPDPEMDTDPNPQHFKKVRSLPSIRFK